MMLFNFLQVLTSGISGALLGWGICFAVGHSFMPELVSDNAATFFSASAAVGVLSLITANATRGKQ